LPARAAVLRTLGWSLASAYSSAASSTVSLQVVKFCVCVWGKGGGGAAPGLGEAAGWRAAQHVPAHTCIIASSRCCMFEINWVTWCPCSCTWLCD
jgi:hypothetical protein